MKNIIVRGSVSANFVIKTPDVNLELDKSNKVIKSAKSPSSLPLSKNKVNRALNQLNKIFAENDINRKQQEIMLNVNSYQKQSEVVEDKLNNIKLMEKAYKSGLEKLQKMQQECDCSNEKKEELKALEDELKDLHKKMVADLNGCINNTFALDEKPGDELEVPDILGDLERKNEKGKS